LRNNFCNSLEAENLKAHSVQAEDLRLKEGAECLDDQKSHLEHHLSGKLIIDKKCRNTEEFKRTIQLVQIPKKVRKTTGMG
jgi:hypothetical protein